MPDLRHRRLEPEWMDDPAVDPAELTAALAFIRRINVALGYTRATVSHLRRFSGSWGGRLKRTAGEPSLLAGRHSQSVAPSRPDAANGGDASDCKATREILGAGSPATPITLLDVATGTADVPRAVLRWADRAGHDVRIVGLDLHAATLTVAADQNRDPRLTFVRGDALALPFADRSFDYVLSGMFLHHLPEPAVVAALREMDRVARRGVVVADLLRNRRAYAWIQLFTLAASAMVRHDARGSVAGAFTTDELVALRDRAGMAYAKPFRHFGHRLVLAGERSDVPAPRNGAPL